MAVVRHNSPLHNAQQFSVEFFRDVFSYSPMYGNLIWNPFRSRQTCSSDWQHKRFHSLRAGRLAGELNGGGYRRILLSLDNVEYLFLAHHVVWRFFDRSLSAGAEIDHVNGRRDDNRIENLRLVNRASNAKNLKLNRKNTSGVTGVGRVKDHWIATIKCDGDIIWLGRFDGFDDAVTARRDAELKYFGEFARDPEYK